MSFINVLIGGNNQQVGENEESINRNDMRLYDLELKLYGKMNIDTSFRINYKTDNGNIEYDDFSLPTGLYNLKELIDTIVIRIHYRLLDSSVLGDCSLESSFDGETLTIIAVKTSGDTLRDGIYVEIPDIIGYIFFDGLYQNRISFLKNGSTFTAVLNNINPTPQSIVDSIYLTIKRTMNNITTPVKNINTLIGVENVLP